MSKYPAEMGDLGGFPIGLQEVSSLPPNPREISADPCSTCIRLAQYYAEYPESNGDILLLAMPIAKVQQLLRRARAPHPSPKLAHPFPYLTLDSLRLCSPSFSRSFATPSHPIHPT